MTNTPVRRLPTRLNVTTTIVDGYGWCLRDVNLIEFPGMLKVRLRFRWWAWLTLGLLPFFIRHEAASFLRVFMPAGVLAIVE